MIYFYTGGAGEGKSYALAEAIRNINDSDIFVIVPEQYSYECDKNLYRLLKPKKFNSISTFSFKTLTEKILEEYGDDRIQSEYANGNKKAVLMNLALSAVYESPDDNLFYKKQYRKNGFSEYISEFINEIKHFGISLDEFKNKIGKFSGKLHEKMNDILKIYLEYERLMSEFGFKDNLDDAVVASHMSAEKKYFKGKTVIIDEFDDFTGARYEMIKSMIMYSENVYIGLKTEDVNAPEFTLFDNVNSTFRNIVKICSDCGKKYEVVKLNTGKRFKYDDLRFLSRNIFRNNRIIYDKKSDNVKIFEARNFYSEIEYICAEIKHLIYKNPDLKYNDIAVISNNIEEYAPILETAFSRYEIPYFMSIKKDVSHTVTMIYIFSLLDIISSERYSTENILKYLKTGLTEISLAETSELENFCYKWSIDGKKWNNSFIPESEFDNEEFIKYEDIRERIIKPLDELKENLRNENTTADKICTDIYNFIISTGADEKIKEIINYYIKNNESYLASEQKKIWDFLIDIIDDLHSVLYGRKMPLKQFSILFKQLLMQAKYSVPPQTLDGVITASIGISRLNSPKIVFILGANEENFPKSSMQDNLFLNDERQKLAVNGFNDKKTQEHSISVARLDVHKALSSAQEKLYISYSLTSLQGESLYMSSVINDVLSVLSMEKSDIIHESDINEDYYAVTHKSAYYHLMQNKKDAGESEKAIRLVLEKIPEYKTKIDYVYKRSSQEENYKLSDRKILEKLVNFKNFRVSNTSLKKYNSCHFSYFCDYCLKLKKRQKIEMDNLNWGSLRHECFCVLLSSKKPLFTDMNKKEIEDIIREVCQRFRDKTFKNGFKEDTRTDFLFIKIAEQLLKVCMNLQKELKMSDFIPTEFEVDINKNNEFSPLFIDGKNGTIIFGGTIDRIDVYTSDDGKNYIRIIDYKSSGQNIEKFLVNNGIDMQMILYMLALTKRGKFRNYFPAGLLYYPITYGLPSATKRDNSPNSSYLEKELKLKGVALSDEDILSAMDKGNPRTYIQTEKIGRTKPVVKAFNKKQFDDLIKFSENKIKEMNESLYDGDIDIDPLINKNYKIDACQYCEFVDICGNYPVFRSHTGDELDESDINDIFEPKKDDKGE